MLAMGDMIREHALGDGRPRPRRPVRTERAGGASRGEGGVIRACS